MAALAARQKYPCRWVNYSPKGLSVGQGWIQGPWGYTGRCLWIAIPRTARASTGMAADE